LFDVRKDFAKAAIVDVIEPSSVRAEPPCGLFKVCGGCQWQHMSYEGQLQAKTDIVRQALRHIGGQNEDVVRPTIGAKNPLFYRNKVQYPVKNPQNSMRILAGYYQQDSHKLVNIKHCPVQPEPLDRMLEAVKNATRRRAKALSGISTRASAMHPVMCW
jgi:23S rRNA (uracil1939-C5)-methyltransferase